MTLPTGQISLSQVNTELGRSSSAALSMSDSELRTLAGRLVGVVSMDDLRGRTLGETLSVVTGSTVQGESVSAALSLSSDGTLTLSGTNFTTKTERWYSPITSSIGNSYWVQVTVAAGTNPSGASLGTWLALSSSRSWTLTTTFAPRASQLTVSIATDSGGSNVVATATVYLEVEGAI